MAGAYGKCWAQKRQVNGQETVEKTWKTTGSHWRELAVKCGEKMQKMPHPMPEEEDEPDDGDGDGDDDHRDDEDVY